MNDQMFVETLIISSTFFTIAMILVMERIWLRWHPAYQVVKGGAA